MHIRSASRDRCSSRPLENSWLGQLEYLNVCINEGMRLMHPFHKDFNEWSSCRSNTSRKFIPGGTLVSVSPMTVQRDARNFTHPDQFIPERWLEGSKETCNKDAWIPSRLELWMCWQAACSIGATPYHRAVVRNFDLTFAQDLIFGISSPRQERLYHDFAACR